MRKKILGLVAMGLMAIPAIATAKVIYDLTETGDASNPGSLTIVYTADTSE